MTALNREQAQVGEFAPTEPEPKKTTRKASTTTTSDEPTTEPSS